MNGTKVFNYTSIGEDVVKAARAELAKLGYQLVHIAKKSDHPEDNYLYIVVGKQKSGRQAYSVWTLNTSVFGLGYGHYELNYITAMKVYVESLFSAFS